MKKMTTKIIALLFVLIMCFGALPITAFAEPSTMQNVTISADGIVSWDAVEGAYGYYWNLKTKADYINDGYLRGTSTNLKESCDWFDLESGTYPFYLYAFDSSGAQITETWTGYYNYVKNVELTSISIESAPSNIELQYKSEASTDGLKVIANYSDGTTEDITDQVNVSNFSASNKRGTYTATVEFEGMSATFDYTVKLVWWQWIIQIILFGWIWY